MTLTLQTPPMEATEESSRNEIVNLRVPQDPAQRERMAVLLYDMGVVSQGNAAKIAGMTRSAFFDALGRHGVSPYQYEDADDLRADVETALL